MRGDVITIRWPGGPHDFVMTFECLDETIAPHAPGWLWLFGSVGETEIKHLPFKVKDWRRIYARKVEPGVYEMVGNR